MRYYVLAGERIYGIEVNPVNPVYFPEEMTNRSK
jgi:hypothetical protein